MLGAFGGYNATVITYGGVRDHEAITSEYVLTPHTDG